MIAALEPLSIVLLIFGGCCTNVFALEAILRIQSSSGLLITFLQFLFTTIASYPSQFSSEGKFGLRAPGVPTKRWAFIAAMHLSINVLNNWVFAYNISVPVHIILRSFGSVTTMLAGAIRGKRYSTLQMISVLLLTTGVLISAWADSESKGKSMSMSSDSSNPDFRNGLIILLIAQFLSAYMGAYTEETYAKYGANWVESLFYMHSMCLPFFFPMAHTLRQQYATLAATPELRLADSAKSLEPFISIPTDGRAATILQWAVETLPQGILFLSINTMTQIICISGVNLLSAKSSAVTVTIVLNIRKLVSFILSTILFGHDLSNKMILGSTIVFGSGALYGWETSWRLPRQRKRSTEANGTIKKS